MREFRRCIWCGWYSLEKNMIDAIVEVRKEAIKNGEIKDLSQIVKSQNHEYSLISKKKEHPFSKKCNFCGEKPYPFFDVDLLSKEDFHNFDLIDKGNIIEYGYKVYKEYIDFMGDYGKVLPKNIVIQPINGKTYDGLCEYDKNTDTFYISIETDNASRQRQQGKANLYAGRNRKVLIPVGERTA